MIKIKFRNKEKLIKLVKAIKSGDVLTTGKLKPLHDTSRGRKPKSLKPTKWLKEIEALREQLHAPNKDYKKALKIMYGNPKLVKSGKFKEAEKVIKILDSIFSKNKYKVYFKNVNIDLKGKQFRITGLEAQKPIKSGKGRELTVGDTLNWSNKHIQLKGEGVRVVHVKHLLESYRQQTLKQLDKLTDNRPDKLFKGATENPEIAYSLGRKDGTNAAIDKVKEMVGEK